MKTLVLMSILVLCSFFGNAEELQIKSFSVTMEPMTVPMQRVDKNGEVCALVKVIVPSAQAAFEGNLIGQSEYKTAEYWCYLTPGSKFLKIKYPECEPLMVNFETLTGSGLQGKRIYELIISVPEKAYNKSSSHESMIFNVTGKISFGEMYAGNRYQERRRFNEIISDTKVYLNYRNGKYDKVIGGLSEDLTGTALGGLYAQFKIDGVKYGDSLTVIPGDSQYAPQTLPVDNPQVNFHLIKKRVVGKYTLKDAHTHEPMAGVLIFKNGRDRVAYDDNKNAVDVTPLAVTDSLGRFEITFVIGEEARFNVQYLPLYNTNGDYRTEKTSDEFNILRKGSYLNIVLDKNYEFNELEITAPDRTKVRHVGYQRGDSGKLRLSFPVQLEPEYILISYPGYKTVKIKKENFSKNSAESSLKLKKGSESEITEYQLVDHKWKEVK